MWEMWGVENCEQTWSKPRIQQELKQNKLIFLGMRWEAKGSKGMFGKLSKLSIFRITQQTPYINIYWKNILLAK